MDIEVEKLREKFELIAPFLDERLVRLWAGNEARVLGRGDLAALVRATGLSEPTVRRGLREVEAGETQRMITGDGGGSNSSRSRVWKAALQDFADDTGLAVAVCHFPPGASKWNRIEHRLFSHIAMN